MEKPSNSQPGQATTRRPPIYTLIVEVAGWTLDRTADIPKHARFTFGQRLDNLCLDALQDTVKAIFASEAARKIASLSELMLRLEQLQALWRLVCDRRWISQAQLLFICGKLDEAGRMANGWRQQQTGRRSGAQPGAAAPRP